MKHPLLFFVLIGFLCACANKPYVAEECYQGEVNPENNSYLQVCFVSAPDPRGRFIYYESTPVYKGSSHNKETLCKQRFQAIRNGNLVTLESKIGECGVRDNYARATQFNYLDEKRFSIDIEECRFTSVDMLSCKRTKTDKIEFFRKVKHQNEI